MQAIARSEELKSSVFLVEFLTQVDQKKFTKDQKKFLKENFGRTLNDFANKNGMLRVQMDSKSAAFCSKMGDFIETYEILFKEMIECSKEINMKSQELATQMFAMHKFLEQIAELNKLVNCDL